MSLLMKLLVLSSPKETAMTPFELGVLVIGSLLTGMCTYILNCVQKLRENVTRIEVSMTQRLTAVETKCDLMHGVMNESGKN
jgi:hypothetical protein